MPFLTDDPFQSEAVYPTTGALTTRRSGALSAGSNVNPVRAPKPKWVDYLGDVALPLLATVATGGFGAPAAFAYGIGAAQARRRMANDPLAQEQYSAAVEDARAKQATSRYIAENPNLGAPASIGVPAEVMANEYYRQNPQAMEVLQQRRAAGQFGRMFEDEFGNMVRVMPDGTAMVVGQGRSSDVGTDRAVSAARRTAEASGYGRVFGESSPDLTPRLADREAEITASGKQAEFNEIQYGAAGDALTNMRISRNILDRLREAVVNGPETGPVEQMRQYVSADMQRLRAHIKGNVMASYGRARANGVTFGAMTHAEWELLENLGARLGNTREANLAIIDDTLSMLDEQIGETAGRMRRIPQGRGRAPVTGGDQSAPSAADYLNRYKDR